VLPHIKRLDECFGDFLVRVSCPCGASRHIEPEALARIAGRSRDADGALDPDALVELRKEGSLKWSPWRGRGREVMGRRIRAESGHSRNDDAPKTGASVSIFEAF
jgi:hypothetical protein